MKLYGRTYHCPECGSDNVVERWRWRTGRLGDTEYPVAACRTCGTESGL